VIANVIRLDRGMVDFVAKIGVSIPEEKRTLFHLVFRNITSSGGADQLLVQTGCLLPEVGEIPTAFDVWFVAMNALDVGIGTNRPPATSHSDQEWCGDGVARYVIPGNGDEMEIILMSTEVVDGMNK